MLVPKDVYEYITNFADDKTIVNMLSVNKKFDNEEIFTRVINKKYPLIFELQRKNENKKQLFLRIGPYIRKLYVEFGIPYMYTQNCNPERFYRNHKTDPDIYKRFFEFAAYGGRMDLVKLMMTKDVCDFNQGMAWAAYGDQMEIVHFMIGQGATDFDHSIKYSIRKKNINMVKFFLEKGVVDINTCLDYAAEEGFTDIANLFLEKGATDIISALKTGIFNYKIKIVKLFLEKGLVSLERAEHIAREYEREGILLFLEEYKQ